MSLSLKKCLPKLKSLCKSPSSKKNKRLLGDKEVVNCICEITKNILKGNIPLTLKHKKILFLHKKALRNLSSKKIPKNKKIKIIQKGGFLGALLTPLLSLLGGLIGSRSSE